MKLAFVTLMSCLIAVSWQQHNQRHQSGANPYWSRPQYQQLQSPYYHQNYPPFYPDYYRGPYSPLSAPSYPNYQQQQQPQQPFYKQQRPSQLDELKLAALLSQLSQEQQQLKPKQSSEKQVSPQKLLDLDLLAKLNKDSGIFIAQQQDINEPVDDEAIKQFLAGSDDSVKNQQQQQDDAAADAEGRGKLGAFLLGAQILSTTTSYSFVTSTITSTSVISCIVSASFYGGSTQACRRKRFVPNIEADEDQNLPFNPSAVLSVEPSAIDEQLDLSRQPRSIELISSFQQPEDRDDVKMTAESSFVRVQRQFFGSTITSTITKYSISTTNSYKTIQIGSSLSCLPTGYSLC